MSEVIDITTAKKGKKERDDEPKVSLAERFRILSYWVDDPRMVAGLPESWAIQGSATRAAVEPIHNSIGGRVIVCQESPRNREPLWLIGRTNGRGQDTVEIVSIEYLAAKVSGWLAFNARDFPGCGKWAWEYEISLRFLRYHMCRTRHKISLLPDPMGFAGTPGLVFHRTGFDPTVGAGALAQPVFSEILSRITENREALMLAVARIFDPTADRKQAVWLSGPADSGKSQVQEWLAWLCGPAYCTLTASDLKSPHWREKILGKRVVCVTEAQADFLNTDDFKSITGDGRQSVNPKGKPMYEATMSPLMWFFSNHRPAIEGAEELARRVIYCPIGAVDRAQNDLINERDYQAMLQGETEAFVSRCWEAYMPYQGKRLPIVRTKMEEVVDQGESWAIDIWSKLFCEDSTGEVTGEQMNDLLAMERIHRGKQRNSLIEIWQRRYNIRYGRKRINGEREYVWHGFCISKRAESALYMQGRWKE